MGGFTPAHLDPSSDFLMDHNDHPMCNYGMLLNNSIPNHLAHPPNDAQNPLNHSPDDAIRLPQIANHPTNDAQPHLNYPPTHMSMGASSSSSSSSSSAVAAAVSADGFDCYYEDHQYDYDHHFRSIMALPSLVDEIHSDRMSDGDGDGDGDGMMKCREIRRSLEGSLTMESEAVAMARTSETAGERGAVTVTGNAGGKVPPKKAHISVERNRRRQMNDHIGVLRSLMPASYAQRGDQASIIGGVVEFVKELEQLLASLEAQKRRRRCVAEAVKGAEKNAAPKPENLGPKTQDCGEMVALRRSEEAEVEVKLAGGTEVKLRTLCVSHGRHEQLSGLVEALERLDLHVLHLSIATPLQGILLYTFTLKIGIDCKLSVDDLADMVQQIFKDIRSKS